MQAARVALTGPRTANLLCVNRIIIPFLRGKVNERLRLLHAPQMEGADGRGLRLWIQGIPD